MHKKILHLAIPNIISNLSVPLLSSVDTIVVGHLEKVSYLAAIALGTMIFHFIYMGLGFLRMGTTGLTAQAFGSKNEEEISSVLGRAVLVALGCAAVLLIAQSLISNISFYLVDASIEVETLAAEYFDIRIWAAPATLSLYSFSRLVSRNAECQIPLDTGGIYKFGEHRAKSSAHLSVRHESRRSCSRHSYLPVSRIGIGCYPIS